MCPKVKELWSSVCRSCNVDECIASKWFDNVISKYDSEPDRVYHNSRILRSKCAEIHELDASKRIPISNALVFAIFFQYYHFNVQSSSADLNCQAFLSFCAEANLDDVSDDSPPQYPCPITTHKPYLLRMFLCHLHRERMSSNEAFSNYLAI